MAGSGKSTLAKGLVTLLKAERIYVGGIRRELAQKKGLTLGELNTYALTHPETDVDVDKAAAAQARKEEKKGKIVIVEGRTQFHFLPESIKIFVKVSPEVAAQRIWKDLQDEQKKSARNEGNFSSWEEVKKSVIRRDEEDAKRYLKYYGFDHRKESNYDFVLDSSKLSIDEELAAVMKFLKKKMR